MNRNILIGILVFPGTALVYVPGIILWVFADDARALDLATTEQFRFYIGMLFALIGLALAIWSARLFSTEGEGTPAPWSPPKNFVATGPYRYVRNPMILGILLALGGESVIFGSWYLGVWLLLLFIANLIYIRFFEEAELEQRFGQSYLDYKADVPSWLPKFQQWNGKIEK